MRMHFALAAGLCLAAGLHLPAAGNAPRQPVCDQRHRLIGWLAKHHGESPRFHASDRRGYRIEFLASPRGSWTLVVVRPDGRACIAAAGHRWRRDRGL